MREGKRFGKWSLSGVIEHVACKIIMGVPITAPKYSKTVEYLRGIFDKKIQI